MGSATVDGSRAESRQVAEEKARAAIATSLLADVERELVTQTEAREERRGGRERSEFEVELRDLTRVVGKATLDGARIVARHASADGRTLYALAAMPRGIAARNVAARIATLREDAEAQLELAERLREREGTRAAGLGALLEAYELYLEARVAESTHRVLVGRSAPVERPDRGAVVRARLAEYLGDLRLEVVEGQDQRGSVGAPLPREVVLRVTMREGGNDEPVSGVRLVLRPDPPNSARLSTEEVVTGPGGTARFRVPLVRYTGRSANRIRASFEAARLGELDVPSVAVRFELPTRDTLRILLVVDERNVGGKAVEPPIVGPRLRDRLRAAGFPLVDTGDYEREHGKRRLLEGSSEELAPRLADDVDLLLRSRAVAEAAGTFTFPQADLPAVRATVLVEGLDLRSGQVVLNFEMGPLPEAHRDREQAGRRALGYLTDELEGDIVKRIESALLGGKEGKEGKDAAGASGGATTR